jgi:hypothetical protein
MKKIAHDKPGNLGSDISRDYVYTEWDGVRKFAEEFMADLAEAGKPTESSSGPRAIVADARPDQESTRSYKLR